jgi:hypothetical protein
MRLSFILSLIASTALANVITLDATTESLEVQTLSAASTDYTVSYLDLSSGTPTPGSSHGNVASITTTTVLAAPAASTQRAVTAVSLCNVGTTSQSLIVKHDTSGTERVISRASLGPSECLQASNDGSWNVATSGGVPKRADQPTIINGKVYTWWKAATATDAATYGYAPWKDAGGPGAYSLGTPGLNGVVTNCSVVGTAGSGGALSLGAPLFTNAASGSLYLRSATVTAQAVGPYQLVDVLWYNTGLVVTTTTAQNITQPTLPARDGNGATSGEGVSFSILTTTANTNAAVVNTSTFVYTDSDGNSPNTGTLFNLVGFMFPATPVIGTHTRFNLAAGDRGVRSVESVTLATSLGAGAISAVLYRPIATVGVAVANTPVVFVPEISPRLYNGSCLAWIFVGGTGTTAPAIGDATIQVVER